MAASAAADSGRRKKASRFVARLRARLYSFSLHLAHKVLTPRPSKPTTEPVETSVERDATEKPFRFFDLPREVRDLIYASERLTAGPFYSHGNHATSAIEKINEVDCIISRVCKPSLLQVSRRFRDEYEEEVYRRARLTVLYPRMRRSFTPFIKVGDMMLKLDFLREVKIYLYTAVDALGSIVKADVDEVRDELREIIPMLPSLRKVHVKVMLRIDNWDIGLRALNFSLPPVVEARLDINQTYETILSGPLFYVNLHVVEDEHFAGYLEDLRRNRLLFRATPSDGPYAWHGLDLEMLEASEWNYERAKRVYRWYYDGSEEPVLGGW